MQHSTTATTPNGKVNGIVTSISSPIAPHSTLDSAAAAKRMQERENLSNIIAQWNANRLDLFEISEPNEVSHPCLDFLLFVFGLSWQIVVMVDLTKLTSGVIEMSSRLQFVSFEY